MGSDEDYQLEWNDEKSDLCRKRRGFSLREVAIGIFSSYYAEYTVEQYPTQSRAVGKHKNKFYTLVFEEVKDELGEYIHLVTYWQSEDFEINYYFSLGENK